LFKLLHPSGTKVVPINALKSEYTIDKHSEPHVGNSYPLSHYTGLTSSNATMYGSFTNMSNNIIKLDALNGANIATFINVGDYISATTANSPNVFAEVTSVNYTAKTITLKNNTFLRFANIAYANVIASNTRINITEITNQYDLINNGEYANTYHKANDIFFIGDSVRLYVNATYDYTGTITYVSYGNNTIFVTPAPTFTYSTSNVWVRRNMVSTNINIFKNLD